MWLLFIIAFNINAWLLVILQLCADIEKVEVTAVPVMKDISDERRSKRLSRFDTTDGSLAFGGHPPPRLDVPYHVTVKDNHDSYHAICIMKVCHFLV